MLSWRLCVDTVESYRGSNFSGGSSTLNRCHPKEVRLSSTTMQWSSGTSYSVQWITLSELKFSIRAVSRSPQFMKRRATSSTTETIQLSNAIVFKFLILCQGTRLADQALYRVWNGPTSTMCTIRGGTSLPFNWLTCMVGCDPWMLQSWDIYIDLLPNSIDID